METFSALLALCAGNSPVTGEFPSQRPVTRSSDGFLDLRLNKRLGKQSRCRWLETPSDPLWYHCNDISQFVVTYIIWNKPCIHTCTWSLTMMWAVCGNPIVLIIVFHSIPCNSSSVPLCQPLVRAWMSNYIHSFMWVWLLMHVLWVGLCMVSDCIL